MGECLWARDSWPFSLLLPAAQVCLSAGDVFPCLGQLSEGEKTPQIYWTFSIQHILPILQIQNKAQDNHPDTCKSRSVALPEGEGGSSILGAAGKKTPQ